MVRLSVNSSNVVVISEENNSMCTRKKILLGECDPIVDILRESNNMKSQLIRVFFIQKYRRNSPKYDCSGVRSHLLFFL